MLQDLVHKVVLYNPRANVSLLSKAYHFAEKAHGAQKRISGEPYILHPLAVARILAELELDLETLEAALLHDVVEDTTVTLEQIEAEFGAEVALLVDGVTKLSRLEYRSKEERQAENLRKMFLAMARDIRVILIKLADRLHNMRTLKYQPAAKQKEIAQETMEIFAPLAHRLGIYHMKWELEDLSFHYLEPEKYYELARGVASTRRKREEFINGVIAILQEKLSAVNIRADIQGRPKHLYSIYSKMAEQQKNLNEIYDVQAVRVIVDSVRDCYAALGTVHTIWKPIPGRFKDYIAMPKSNMYQSLHTTVVGPRGEPLEIQIRTREMHRTAEYGIAAHWRYKEGGRGDKNFEQKLAWLRQLMEWQHDLRDAREFMEGLKIDLFADTVFVFTPQGDVLELPAGSVPIDFAYRVHTQVGHRCVGAKVNGRIVPLDYKLKNGDIVEILTSKQASGPSRDWLKLVKTSQAKSRIRQWFKKEQREENIVKGHEALEKEIKKQGLDPEIIKGDRLLEFGRRLNLNALEDVYAAVGEGTVTALAVLNRIRDEIKPEKKGLQEEMQQLKPEQRAPSEWGRPTQGIRVRGVDNLLIRLAHCCNPVPGDPIVGYITRGRGVSIHRSDCYNVAIFQQGEPDRLVEAAWDQDFQASFQVKLEVTGMDRAGFLSDVMAVLTDMKISANWVTARGRKNHQAVIEMVLEMKSKEQLELVSTRIKRIPDVYEVRRTS
ncbi:RelA/SpoT family protein [Desulfotomaculum copahuensis]|uniref:GTP diphosphokinase n=1 Tax=Desulfotomaculum copahuensis TaxID=1838280 RepID=A0A1B7LGA6_9FIRM|nr:bifunctional (p)ppGpp synthetase/guanosine-3',5'-bis(diphosphate) 3'-pyrophosphohydrolase [Desulfotomaculum copahuensis]OAT85002.1 (p)ppGpp synthetase [Desulfotomaculum copahuensis]